MERNNRLHTTQHARSFKDETANQDEYAMVEITSIRPVRPPRKPRLYARQRRYVWLGLVAIVIIIALVSIPIGIINYRHNLPSLKIAGNPLWTFSDTGIIANTPQWNTGSTQFSFSTNLFTKTQMYNFKTQKVIQYPIISKLATLSPYTKIYSSPGGNYIVTIDYNQDYSQKYHLSIWDIITGKLLSHYNYHTNQAKVAASDNTLSLIWWSTGNTQMATLDNDGSMIIWQAKSGKLPFRLSDTYMPPSYVTWSADGKELAASTVSGNVEIWNLTNKARISIGLVSPKISNLTFSPDAQHLVALDNDSLYLLSTHNGIITADNTLYILITDGPPVIWSADSHYMIVEGNDFNSSPPNITSSVAIWDVSGTKKIMTTHIFRATTETAVVSPDRRYLATLEPDGNTVDVWEINSGHKVATHHGIMKNSNYLLAWSPDGKYLAGTFQNNEVHIWNALTGKDIMLINKVPSIKNNSFASIQNIQWSPDNSYIAVSASNDQDLQVQATYKYVIAIWNAPQN
jgi:WD40 repeat protein